VLPEDCATLEALAVVPSVPVPLIPDVSLGVLALALAVALAPALTTFAVTAPSVAFTPGEVELWV
jgi:hypothetical protein